MRHTAHVFVSESSLCVRQTTLYRICNKKAPSTLKQERTEGFYRFRIVEFRTYGDLLYY